jgi:hypothetical protein
VLAGHGSPIEPVPRAARAEDRAGGVDGADQLYPLASEHCFGQSSSQLA